MNVRTLPMLPTSVVDLLCSKSSFFIFYVFFPLLLLDRTESLLILLSLSCVSFLYAGGGLPATPNGLRQDPSLGVGVISSTSSKICSSVIPLICRVLGHSRGPSLACNLPNEVVKRLLRSCTVMTLICL